MFFIQPVSPVRSATRITDDLNLSGNAETLIEYGANFIRNYQ
jgi:hypothetical protein